MNKVLIVIPVINEMKNLTELIPNIYSLLPSAHILIIDDSSTDGTESYCANKREEYPEQFFYKLRDSRQGIGSAHTEGIMFAIMKKYEILISMDGDKTHDPIYLIALLEAFKSNSSLDLIIGSRFLPKSNIIGWQYRRQILTKAGHLFTRVKFRSSFDMSSGLRLYKVSRIPKGLTSDYKFTGYEFFPRSLILYIKAQLSIGEIPVTLYPRLHGESKLTLIQMVKSFRRTFINKVK
jgi:dolichol-phosphate mannosyltransferase